MGVETEILQERIHKLERQLQAALESLADWKLCVHAILCAKLNGEHDPICKAIDEELRQFD